MLRIILAGQPELNDKLDAPELEQLAQRIRLRFHLPALTSIEMRAYILHRLEVAGSQGREIFANDTFELIFRYTGGVPRLINTLCDTAMLAASNNESRHGAAARTSALRSRNCSGSEYSSRTGTRLMRLRADSPAEQGSGDPRARARNDADAPLARILLATGGRTVSERALYPGRLIIGRTSANDLQIESRFVSRHHCQIVTTAQSCVIEDLNSTNGIFLHSKRVRYHNLNDGDVVMIGQHELLYIDERGQHRGSGEREPHAASSTMGEQSSADTGT